MAAKSTKGKNAGGKSAPNAGNEIPKKEPVRAKNELEEEDDEFLDEEDETESIKASSRKTAKTTSKKGKEESDDDDEEDEKEIVDEWEKPEEEPEEWDPDFEEFDLPKSKAKKSGVAGGKKVGKKEEDDELGLDEEFKDLDLFNDRGFDDDEEDF